MKKARRASLAGGRFTAALRRGHIIEQMRRSGLLAREHRRGKRVDLGVYVLLADRAHLHGWAAAKTDWIARQLQCTKSAVTRSIGRLEEANLIRREAGAPWRFHFPQCEGEVPLAVGRGQWGIIKACCLAYGVGKIRRIEPLLHLLRVASRRLLAARETRQGNLLAVLKPVCGAEWAAVRRYLREIGAKVAAGAKRGRPRAWALSLSSLLGEKAARTAARMVRLTPQQSLAAVLAAAVVAQAPPGVG